MIRLTVEEMNLLSIYHEGSKAQLMENMTAALPFMDEDMRPFAEDVYKRQVLLFEENGRFSYISRGLPFSLNNITHLINQTRRKCETGGC